MEIYVNAIAAERVVILDFPYTTGAQLNATVFSEGEQVYEFATLGTTAPTPTSTDFYTATMPLFLIQFDSRLYIHWDVTYLDPADSNTYTVSKITPVDIVTPILTKAEIKAVWDDATDAEVTTIEKAVRHIIKAYTGQEFGRYIGTIQARGTGGMTLALPKRLLTIETFEGIEAATNQFTIGNGGYTLSWTPYGVPPVKADFYGYHQIGGVIHNPNNVKLSTFNSTRTYVIGGHWGWEAVPDDVKEAAKLLVNDYACSDAQYRDRYLVSMTAADWRISFYSGAYLRTGNVRADQLLSDFVVTRGWGII